ncbi:MAG TPA: hypothetical protein VGH19_10475 [Verrucomicrobiae bacterium]
MVVIRGGAYVWRVLRSPEETRRLWEKYHRVIMVGAIVFALVFIGGVMFAASFAGKQVKIAEAGHDYLTKRYGAHTNLSMHYSSSDAKKGGTNSPGSTQWGYEVGTNSGVLTLERREDEQVGFYYVVIRDDPKP